MSVPRLPALLAFVILLVALVAVVVVTTPWQPLGPDAPRVIVPDQLDEFGREVVAKEDAFHRAVYPPGLTAFALTLVVAAVLGLTPLGARLIGAVPGHWSVKAAFGGLAVSLVPTVLTLPLNAWRETVLRRFGLSTQTWGSWTLDQLKAALVGAVLLVVVAVGLVGLARLAPRTWWAWGAAGGALLVVLASFVFPLVVEPLFNTFEPLPASPLRDRIVAVAERDGLPVDEILVADASRRTTALNAYVSGFGSTRRVVLYDTLVEQATPEEVELVVAHELGHVKNDDVVVQTLTGALAAAVAVCGLFLLLTSRYATSAGSDGPGDPRSLALVLFAIAAVSFLTSPVQCLVSRRVEARADVHSLEITGNHAAFVASERRLAVTNLADLDPHPVLYAFFYTHPTTLERIGIANAWASRR